MGLASLRDIFTREKLPGSIIGWDGDAGVLFGLGFFRVFWSGISF